MSALRILPWTAHQAVGYLAGIFLVLAPFMFGLLGSAALPVLLGSGVVLLATAVLSRGQLGIMVTSVLVGLGLLIVSLVTRYPQGTPRTPQSPTPPG